MLIAAIIFGTVYRIHFSRAVALTQVCERFSELQNGEAADMFSRMGDASELPERHQPAVPAAPADAAIVSRHENPLHRLQPQLGAVWQRVHPRRRSGGRRQHHAVHRAPSCRALLDGYDIAIDDHSYMPTAGRAVRSLKHIVFLGTGAASYMNVGELEARGVTVHTIKGYGDTAVAEHTIALMFACAPRRRAHGPQDPRRPWTAARRRAAVRQDARRHRARRHRPRGRAHRPRAWAWR